MYASGTLAQEDFFQSIQTARPAPASESTRTWDYRAYVQQIFKYGWQAPPASDGLERNRPGFSQVKTIAFWEGQDDWNGHAGWQLSAQGENEWYLWDENSARWTSHNSALRLRDAFVDLTFADDVWLRGGHQILAWGQSEGMVITDVLSPQDLREPGQAELQDVREQVPALLASVPLGRTKATAVITYAAGANRYADAGDAFDFFARYRQLGLTIAESDPTSEWEYALKLDYQFHGGDLSLVTARVNDNNLSLQNLAPQTGALNLGQQRQTVVGVALNRALGNWLLKGEAAHWSHVAVPARTAPSWPTHAQTRAMAGVEYSGWEDATLSLEFNGAHTEGHSPDLAVGDKEAGYVARLRHTMHNERIAQQWWLMKLANEEAFLGRWDLALDWSDHWTFSVGAVVYRISEKKSLFYPVRHNDSLNVSAKYSF